MERISILYFYPEIERVNNELNLIRIVDNEMKESVIIFADVKDEVEIYITNTNVGQVIPIIKYESEDRIKDFISKIGENENKIKSINDLAEIEKFILEAIKY